MAVSLFDLVLLSSIDDITFGNIAAKVYQILHGYNFVRNIRNYWQ